MLMGTNIPSSIAIAFMLLSLFYTVYDLHISKNLLKYSGSLVLMCLISTTATLILNNGLLSLAIVSMACMFLFNIIEKKNPLEYIFIALYFILLKLLAYVFVAWISNLVSYEVIFPIHYTIYLSDILLGIALLSTVKLLKIYLFKIRKYTIFYIAIHIVLILLYLTYLITIFKKGELLIETSIEIVLISTLVLLIYKMVNKVIDVERENYLIKLHNEELKFNQKNYHNLLQNINETKKIKHDLNHFLLSLLDYCENKNYDDLHQALKSKLNVINDPDAFINTGNPSLNLILSSQLSRIKNEHIEFITNAFEDEIYIDKIDFYVLLGNLLDNAIENCSSQSIKKILLDIYTKDQSLSIMIKNTCLNNPLAKNPQLNTSKKDAHNHGLGLTSVEEIVKKYHGTIVYDYSYHYFVVHLNIENKKTLPH